jgi:hypothetical protein
MPKPKLTIGERTYTEVPPGVFEVPLPELGDFRIGDIPPHTSIHVIGLPPPPEDYTFSISVTNGAESGSLEFLDIFGFAGFESHHQPDRKMSRIRRAFLPFVERELLRDPLVLPPRRTDAGTSNGAGFSISCAGRPETVVRVAIRPLLELFQKLSLPEARLFVCHASEDKKAALELGSYLSSRGVEVWLDDWEIRVGDSIVAKINEGLEAASHLALLLSANSVNKPWVKREFSSALMRQLRNSSVSVLPIRLDDSAIPAVLADIRYADCRANLQSGCEDVLRAIFPTSQSG